MPEPNRPEWHRRSLSLQQRILSSRHPVLKGPSMRKISLILGLIACLFISQAHADFTAKDASLATITFKNPGACTSVVCTPIAAIVDSTGTNVVAVNTAGADAVSNTANGLQIYSRLT